MNAEPYTRIQKEVLYLMDTRDDFLTVVTDPRGRCSVFCSSMVLDHAISPVWIAEQRDLGVLEAHSEMDIEGDNFVIFRITEYGKKLMESLDEEEL